MSKLHKFLVVAIILAQSLCTSICFQPIRNTNNLVNERALYKNYLLAIRHTKRFLNSTSILAFTDNSSKITELTITNNTRAKKLIMRNIVIDVAEVKEIHIYAKKEKLIIELDKKSVVPDFGYIDTALNTLSLMAKILNLS